MSKDQIKHLLVILSIWGVGYLTGVLSSVDVEKNAATGETQTNCLTSVLLEYCDPVRGDGSSSLAP